MEKVRLEKYIVCKDCLSISITHHDCTCTYQNGFPTIELEFEVCNCCNNLISDGEPADTEFNQNQLK